MKKSADAFRTISEVADWLGVQAHVLRFWESKFSHVKPVKRAGGRRYYRPADMLLLGGIRKLLHDDGLTIKGVQKLLREEGVAHVANLSQPLDDLTAAQVDSTLDHEIDDAATTERDPSASPQQSETVTPESAEEVADPLASPDLPPSEPLAEPQSSAPAVAHSVPDSEDGDVHVVDSGAINDLRPESEHPVSAAAPVLEDFGDRGSPTPPQEADPSEIQDIEVASSQPTHTEPEPEPEPEIITASEPDLEMPLDLPDPSETAPVADSQDASSPSLDSLADDLPGIETPVETAEAEGEAAPTAPVPLVVDAPDGPAPADITAVPGVLTRAATISALSSQQRAALAPLVAQLRAAHERAANQDRS